MKHTPPIVFSPTSRIAPVDGHVFSPTFFCGWTRVFTHRRHVFSPTKLPKKPSNDAGLQNRNARAQSLTLKIFNALHWPTAVENFTGQPHTKDRPASWGLRPRRIVRLRRTHPPGIPRGFAPRPLASPQMNSPHAYGAGTSRRSRGLRAPARGDCRPPVLLASLVAGSPPWGLSSPPPPSAAAPPRNQTKLSICCGSKVGACRGIENQAVRIRVVRRGNRREVYK